MPQRPAPRQVSRWTSRRGPCRATRNSTGPRRRTYLRVHSWAGMIRDVRKRARTDGKLLLSLADSPRARAGRDGPAFGDAEHRLTVLALDEFPANLVRHRQDLAASQVRADELDGHRRVSRLSYRRFDEMA